MADTSEDDFAMAAVLHCSGIPERWGAIVVGLGPGACGLVDRYGRPECGVRPLAA